MRPLTEFTARVDAFVQKLGTKTAQRLTILVGTLLAASSVGPHLALDDFVLALIARGKGGPVGLPRRELDLFTFTTGDPAGNHRLMDTGLMLPWWTDPKLRISFFRPVASVTHWIDERLFPGSPALMHVHSLLWFAAFLAAACAVYERFETSPVYAGFASLLYAVDHTHGPVVAWLANRNALIAATFGCVALLAHDAWRRGGSRVAAAIAPGALLLGLLSGELAVGALAYLASYALLFEEGTLARRARSLAPYGAVVLGWRILWTHGGYGARGSGAYIDPLGDPLGFAAVLPERFLVLFHGQFSLPPADLAFLAPPPHEPFLVGVAALTFVVVTALLLPILRRDRSSRFWALGMLFAILPLGATFPSDRLLVFVGLGGMALLTRLFVPWLESGAKGRLRVTPASVATCGLLLLHLFASPLILTARASQMELFARAHDFAAHGIASDPAAVTETVVIIAAPTLLFANYIQAERELDGVPRPKHLYVLASASSPIEVTRSGNHRLTVQPARGFLYTPLERHYRGSAPLDVGTDVTLSAMTAHVASATPDGRPRAVEFSFDGPWDRYRFVTFRNGRYEPFTLPSPGESALLPEEDFGKILAEAAVRGI